MIVPILIGIFIGVASTLIASRMEEILDVLFKRPKLNVDVCRHGIQNIYLNQKEKHGYSEVEILLRLSNSGNEPVGISKILVKSKKKDYLIFISMYEYRDNWKNFQLDSLKLEPEETKLIILYQEGNPTISIENTFVEAEIEVYDTEFKIMKSIPIKLYISSSYRSPVF